MDIPYEESLLHTRWLNGLLYWRECNQEEDHKLVETNIKLLTAVAAIAIDNYTDSSAAMISAMGTMLRLGYYIGQNGMGADAPACSAEFLQEHLVPIITPGCDCGSCRAKLDFLKEYGIDYEMTPEREEEAKDIEHQLQVKNILDDTLPPDDFNLSVN